MEGPFWLKCSIPECQINDQERWRVYVIYLGSLCLKFAHSISTLELFDDKNFTEVFSELKYVGSQIEAPFHHFS